MLILIHILKIKTMTIKLMVVYIISVLVSLYNIVHYEDARELWGKKAVLFMIFVPIVNTIGLMIHLKNHFHGVFVKIYASWLIFYFNYIR